MHEPQANWKQAYREQGFAVVPGLLPAAAFLPLYSDIDAAVERHAQDLLQEGKVADTCARESYDRRLAKLYAGRDMGVRMWDQALRPSTLLDFASQPALGGVLADLLGPETCFSGDYHLRPKLPESSLTTFPWHQDSQYYGPLTRHMAIVTAWVPLVDVDEANGCLWVIPGSQRWGLLDGARGSDQNIRTFENVEQRGRAVPVPMKRGDVLFFGNLTFHASKLNRTDRVRWSLDLRYYERAEARPREALEAEAYAYFAGKLRAAGREAVSVRQPALS